MEYFTVAEARKMSGLRLVLSQGVPGPWGESAKKIFEAKGIAYAPVAQMPMQANPELVEWTGIRNAPIAIYEDEAPRAGWSEILCLAERLAPNRPLIPDASPDRALMFGISNEICGVWGLGWCRRLMIVADISASRTEAPTDPTSLQIARDYEVGPDSIAAAPERVADIMRMLAGRLKEQKSKRSRYFIGDRLTACDIHWACFSAMIGPMPKEVNPMPDYLWPLYSNIGPVVAAAKDPILEEHRDFIFQTYFTLPLDY